MAGQETASLVRLSRRDIPDAARVMGQAFLNYPMFTCLYPDERHRRKTLAGFMSVPLYVCVKYGEVYATSAGMEGVAAWLPPGMAPFSMGQTFRAVPLWRILHSGMNGAFQMSSMSQFLDAKHRELATSPHWFLQSIGVRPECQGKGFSGRLLHPMLERMDREGTSCFLETQSEKNVHLYQHFGFKILYQERIPGLELTSWGMLREPAATGRM